MAFCKDFNARTKDQNGMILPVVITVFSDKSFTFILKSPPATVLLKKAAKVRVVRIDPQKDPGLRGSWHGLTLATSRTAMLRSILEGVAQAVALVEQMEGGMRARRAGRAPQLRRIGSHDLPARAEPQQARVVLHEGSDRFAGTVPGRRWPVHP